MQLRITILLTLVLININVIAIDSIKTESPQNIEIKDNSPKDTIDSITINKTENSKNQLLTNNASNDKTGSKDHTKYLDLIIPLLIGFFLNRGFDFFTDKRKIKKEGNRWIEELRCLNQPIDSQAKSIEDFIENFGTNEIRAEKVSIHQILDCEIFKSLDKSHLLSFLKSRKKRFKDAVEASNKVHGFISSLNFVHNHIKQSFNEYKLNTSEHIRLFNDHLQLLMHSLAEFGNVVEKRINDDPINDRLYSQIFQLFNAYIIPHMDDGEFSLLELQNDFLNPLFTILSINRLNDELKELSINSSNCNKELKAIRMEKRYLIDNFRLDIKLLNGSKLNLDNLIKNLNTRHNNV